MSASETLSVSGAASPAVPSALEIEIEGRVRVNALETVLVRRPSSWRGLKHGCPFRAGQALPTPQHLVADDYKHPPALQYVRNCDLPTPKQRVKAFY